MLSVPLFYSALMCNLDFYTYFLFSCSMEGEACWSLVQSFCSCHELSPSTEFIVECAKKAEWLPLLCHAQLYQISTQEVRVMYITNVVCTYMYLHNIYCYSCVHIFY